MSVLSARPGVAGLAGVSKKESPLDFKKILLESVYPGGLKFISGRVRRLSGSCRD